MKSIEVHKMVKHEVFFSIFKTIIFQGCGYKTLVASNALVCWSCPGHWKDMSAHTLYHAIQYYSPVYLGHS